MEIFVTSLVDPVINTAFSLISFQTPGDLEIGRTKSREGLDNETRIDFYLQCLWTIHSQIAGMVKYCIADGYFAKSKFSEGVGQMSMYLISKLRSDANLRFLYKGKEKKRGRPKKYDGKVNFDDLRKFRFVRKIAM